MRKLLRLSGLAMLLLAIVLITTVLSESVCQVSRAQTSSVPVSSPSATPVNDPDAGLRAACAEAVEELKAARKLLASQGVQIEKLNELADLEGKVSTGLKNLRTMDAEEKLSLRNAVAAAEREITAIRAENAVLKKQRMTLWKKAKVFVVGAAAGLVVGAVLINR